MTEARGKSAARGTPTPPLLTPIYVADKAPGVLFTSFHLKNQPSITLKMCPAAGKKTFVTSQLDTYKGQSGSSVWSADLKVCAVHSAVDSKKSYHAPIDKEAVEFIKRFRK